MDLSQASLKNKQKESIGKKRRDNLSKETSSGYFRGPAQATNQGTMKCSEGKKLSAKERKWMERRGGR